MVKKCKIVTVLLPLCATLFLLVACQPEPRENPYANEPWYIWLDSSKVREERGLEHAERYKMYAWRLERYQTGKVLPQNLRACTDEFKPEQRLLLPDSLQNYAASREGLDDLRLSASASFSYDEMDALTDWLAEKADGGPICIMNLRSEYTLFFNDYLVSGYGYNNWANIGRTTNYIFLNEKEIENSLWGQNVPVGELSAETNYLIENTVWLNNCHVYYELQKINLIAREKSLNLSNARIAALDHCFPSDRAIDDFIACYRSLPENAWVHMHSSSGDGRASLFMVLFDMMRNPHVPLNDIICRQCLIGGSCVYHTCIENDEAWRVPLYEEINNLMPVLKMYVDENWETNYQVRWNIWKARKFGKNVY